MTRQTNPQAQPNAFDVIRLLLSLLVVYCHARLLGGFGDDGFASLVKGQVGVGNFAVLGFFGISGFLVSGSFCSRRDPLGFVKARLLRILPALYLSLIFSAYVFAPLISHFNAKAGPWEWASAGSYVLKNLWVRVGSWSVGGVLNGQCYGESLNGALWSLFPELLCYVLVLVLGILGVLTRNRAALVLLVAAVFTLHVAEVVSGPGMPLTRVPTFLHLANVTPFVCSFVAGACLQSFWPEFNSGRSGAVLWSGAALVMLRYGGWELLGPVVLPLALIHLSHAVKCALPLDLSYGLYVFHFPIQQVLFAAGAARLGFPSYFALSLLVTAVFASLSWFLVEKPFLRLKGSCSGG